MKGTMRSIDNSQSINRTQVVLLVLQSTYTRVMHILKNKSQEALKLFVHSQPKNRDKATCIGVLVRAAVLLLFSAQLWLSARAGTFSTDFNSGQPAGCSLFGSAFVDSAGGFGDSGALKLTQAYVYGTQGSFVINDLDGGAPVVGFTATFKMLVGGAEPHADGISFNFANDLRDDSFGEEGAGTGLTISFDSFDNGGGEAPAIDAKFGGVTVASRKNIGGVDVSQIFRTYDFVAVSVCVNLDGTLDLTVNGTIIYKKLPLGFVATSGRFGFGARTGGFTDNHRVDDLSITTSRPTHPYVTSAAPRAYSARPNSVVAITVQDASTSLNASSVKLSFNGALVNPVVAKVGSTTTIQYDPPGLIPPGTNSVSLTYADSGTPAFTNTFVFTFVVSHYQGPNGNFYEIVPARNISWQDAKVAAEQRTFLCSNHGHLATITSAEEDVFVEMIRQEYIQSGFPNGEVWAGGFQLPNQLTPRDGWFWINNEGPISGYNGGSTYSNWNPDTGEPSDCCNTVGFEDNEENYLGIGLFGFGLGWNDEDVSHSNIVGYVVEYERLSVPVDIRPGGYPNPVYLDASGKLPVAILSSATFDASTIDPSTVKFGRTGIEASQVSYSLSDVNGDKRKDLVCQFNIADCGFLCGDTSGVLTANTFSGCPYKGSDTVQILNCPPYALSIQSMQDVHHLTDLYLKVSSILKGHTAPTVAQNLALKSFDIFGKLRWTKTLQNTPLASNPDKTTTADLQYSDMEHGQNVKAQMSVKDSVSGATEVLTTQGRVLSRPDLAVDSLSVPSQVNTHLIVNIFASVKELKGDLGATANVYLKDGNNVIDVVTNFSITPLASVGVTFATVFQTAGAHQLKIVVGDVTPGDYDLSNNEQSFSIEVVQPPLVPVFYCASYAHYDYDYQNVVENPFWISTYHDQYTNEYTSETLYVPASFNSPLANVRLKISADGTQRDNFEVFNVPLNIDYSDGCSTNASGYQNLADGTDFYIQTYQDCYGNQNSYASFSKAYYNEIFFSSYYDKYWQTGSTNSFASGFGTALNATTSVATRFIVQGDAGAFGGNGTLGSLYTYPFDDEFDYYEFDYTDGLFDEHVTGFNRGKSVYGSNCDLTSP